ncbi:hypothetical protein [Streptomyces sp. NPDC014006]|uniref:hypothetical protein n=1 Tax=Streptomyces sp. NPDC014006 TaxID=3364870 RepID=UPI003701E14A
MTKASLFSSTLSGPTADKLPTARGVALGRYIFTPASAYSSPDANGTLHRDGAKVELRVTETLLRELLMLLDTAQEELSRRWVSQGQSDCLASRM